MKPVGSFILEFGVLEILHYVQFSVLEVYSVLQFSVLAVLC